MRDCIRLKKGEETKLSINDLELFLNKKPLFYDKIDYDRMPGIYKKIKHLLANLKVIHIVGTNAKGSTGKFISCALQKANFKVGHYTSPHILKFNERISINNEFVNNSILQKAHEKLLGILVKEDADRLSYFEYTTLLAMVVFEDCDYVVLEAGLGGEYDATAVFDKILTVITPIDYDHQAFLGNDIKQIATTKLNAMSKKVVLSKQKHQVVYDLAKKIASEKNSKLYIVTSLNIQTDMLNIPLFQKENLSTALKVLDILDIKYNIKDFENCKLFGRMTKISQDIIIDVGHNPLAAQAIYEELKNQKYTLVYNSFKDKDYKRVLEILKPIIKKVEILDIQDSRIEKKDKLEAILKGLDIKYEDFKEIKQGKKYLVFGSFSVAEEFLRRFYA